jgi:hypothetical protein
MVSIPLTHIPLIFPLTSAFDSDFKTQSGKDARVKAAAFAERGGPQPQRVRQPGNGSS